MAGLEGVDAGGPILRDDCEDAYVGIYKERREHRIELAKEE